MNQVSLAGTGQTIDFPPLANQKLSAGTIKVEATASSGLPVVFSSQTIPVCSVSGDTVSLLSAGKCTLRADQAGNGTYAPAPSVAQSFLVTQTGTVSQGFVYTGGNQTFVVPPGISKLSIALWGGGGGEYGGAGGHTSGALAVVPGQVLTVVVGGGGVSAPSGVARGGFGGGGNGFSDGTRKAGGGGGRSAVLSSSFVVGVNGTANRIRRAGNDCSARSAVCESSVDLLTAAGGGGGNGGLDSYGAGGGGLSGRNGLASTGAPSGRGGTQTAGGSALPGAVPGALYAGGAASPAAGGGGGAGYFGGGGGGSSSPTAWGGGGGGSSYVRGAYVTADARLPGENGGTQADGGALPAHNTEADPYQDQTARGGGFGANGGNGLVIITYSYDQTISFGELSDQPMSASPVVLDATASSGLPVVLESLTPSTCSVSGPNATLLGVGTCTIQATQDGDSDWAAADPVQRSFKILKGEQKISFGALANQVYGSTPPPLVATASSGLSVQFASLTAGACTVSGTTISMAAIGTCTVQATQPGNENWSAAAPVSQTFQVTNGDQTIAFAALSDRALGTTPPPLSATATSGLPVGFSSMTSAVCTVAGTTVTLKAAGTCTIQATQPGNANYSAAAPVNQSFQVTQASHTITFGALADKTYGDPPFGVSATATSGLAVSFSSLTTPVCTVSGSTVTVVSAGTCTIRAAQPGDLTYPAATPVDQTFAIHKATPVVAWSNPGAIVYGTALSGTQLNATANVPGSFVYTPASGAVLATGNSQTLSVAFTPADTTNYNNASATAGIDVSKAPATVTLGPLAFTHDGTPKAVTATTSPTGLPVAITYNGGPTAPSAVGAYSVVATVTDPNYTGSATGTLTVSASVTFNSVPAGLQVTVDAATQATPFTLVLSPGAHTISVSPPASGSGTRYVWSGWSDGGAMSHAIDVSGSGSYTATFKTQYWLQTSSFPVAGGTVSPASGFFDAGSTVAVSVAVNPGYSFADFSGGTLSGGTNPQNLAMNGPAIVVANYTTTAPQLSASAGARTDGLVPGTRDVAITLRNNGTATAFNATIQSVTDFATVLGSGSVSVASGTPNNLGTINTGGAFASGVVTLNWPSTATRVQFRINYTADGGYSGSTTVTINR